MPVSQLHAKPNGKAAPLKETAEDAKAPSPQQLSATQVIIDTDAGIDDAMAIIYALSVSSLQVHSLTSVFGNVSIDRATRNAIVLADLCDTSTPVSRGAEKPLSIPLNPAPAFAHGNEGFGEVVPPPVTRSAITTRAAEHIVQTCEASPGSIVLVAIGPLTNLARALELDPAITRNVARVIVMGGSLRDGGNMTDYAESNMWQDPHAAERVFSAEWPVEMIGLDVTRQVHCSWDDCQRLAKTGRKGVFLRDAAKFYFKFHKEQRHVANHIHMHDPTAVIAAHAPNLFSFEELPITVVLEGERIGETVVSEQEGRHRIKVATGVDANAVQKLWLMGVSLGDAA